MGSEKEKKRLDKWGDNWFNGGNESNEEKIQILMRAGNVIFY